MESHRKGGPAAATPLWAAFLCTALVGATAAAGQDPARDGLAQAEALGWAVGAASAPVTVVEFTDLSCPHCAGFHEGTRAELHEEFVAPGRVRWITLNYVSGLYPNSRIASQAAECAGRQGAYEEFLEAAFGEREEWVRASGDTADSVLRRVAADLELEGARYRECLTDPGVVARLEAVTRLARTVGVRGTPTWFVDGFPVMGNLPLGYARQFLLTRFSGAGG